MSQTFSMEDTKMTPQRAQKILREHGTILTLEQAEKIIEFMQMLAKIAVTQYLREEEPVNKEDQKEYAYGQVHLGILKK